MGRRINRYVNRYTHDVFKHICFYEIQCNSNSLYLRTEINIVMIYLKYEQWNIVAEACSAIHGCLNSLKTLFKYC